MARFCPLFSGSSGNSYYIGSADHGVLIDAGKNAKQIMEALNRCEIPVSAIEAIFVTHEHSDHVSGLRVFASRHKIPVYASTGTMLALEEQGILNGKFPAFALSEEGMECAGMYIKPFRIPHDCAEGYGYRLMTADGRGVSVATDLGYMTAEVREAVTGSDLLVLESNHDIGMLRTGPYPYALKQRILSGIGHLSNLSCAEELCRFVQTGTTRFWLAHLSQENNTPELAYQTSLCSLKMAGMKENLDFQLFVAPCVNETGKVMVF